MKPFDIEKAKAGAKVCTRDGSPARIICWDAKGDMPIVALVEGEYTTEEAYMYTKTGSFYRKGTHDCDLFLAPEKKEGWVNVYKDLVKYTVGGDYIYPTRKKPKSKSQILASLLSK